jgi:ribosomal-protein-alanine N-acetyltransferase
MAASQRMFPDGFQTSRLTLRPIAAGDVGPIFDRYAQDSAVTRFLTWQPHRNLNDTTTYVQRCMGAVSSRTYVLVGRHDEKLIGAFDLRQDRPHGLSYGYVLARSEWGQGLMTEALLEVSRWALIQPPIWRIGDCCDVENRASGRVMEKAGMTLEGLARRWTMHPNISTEPRDCFIYAKVR